MVADHLVASMRRSLGSAMAACPSAMSRTYGLTALRAAIASARRPCEDLARVLGNASFSGFRGESFLAATATPAGEDAEAYHRAMCYGSARVESARQHMSRRSRHPDAHGRSKAVVDTRPRSRKIDDGQECSVAPSPSQPGASQGLNGNALNLRPNHSLRGPAGLTSLLSERSDTWYPYAIRRLFRKERSAGRRRLASASISMGSP